ncbi:MAG: DUF11 domain-containing protein [Saprospiraceae bacterium]|nr:DUF11 domain-containing protein [Saprospiraceae bacterium]
MKNLIIVFFAVLFSFAGCKILRQQGGSLIKKEIRFCGEFMHGDQPASKCECMAEEMRDATGQIVKTPKYSWFDRFGNKYCNLYIEDPCSSLGSGERSIVPGVNFSGTPNRTSSGGLFDLYVSDLQNGLTSGFGDPSNIIYLDVLTQVFSDIDAMLVKPSTSCGNPFVPVNIEIQSMNSPGSGILGEASPYWENLGETNGIIHNEVWKGICSGANDPALWDGYIRINLGYNNWYTGYAGTVPAGKVDLYTVVLHEVLHAMGFASLIADNGKSKKLTNLGAPSDIYNIFDQFLTFDNAPLIINNTALITNSGSYNTSYNSNSNPVTDLRSGCQNPLPTGPDIKFKGIYNLSTYAYAPNNWSNGSSLSHFQIGCDGLSTPQFVMNPSISTGQARRIKPEEANALCDMGYKLTGTYGTPLLDVGGGTNPNILSIPSCGQLLVAVDDNGPCCQNTNFIIQSCPGNILTITSSNLICNDVFSGTVTVVDFEHILTGTPVPQVGTDFVYTPTQLGTEVFRYRIQDNSGNTSNYAYVRVQITGCTSITCPPITNFCNLICNPDLIDDDNNCIPPCSFNNLSGGSCLEGWGCFLGTPDFFVNSCSGPSTNNQNIPGSQGGKVHLLGMHIYSVAGPGDEGIATPVNVSGGKKYIFSINGLKMFKDIISWGHSAGIEVGLINDNDIFWPPCSTKPILPATLQTIIELPPTAIVSNWNQFVVCFDATTDFDRLFLLGLRYHTAPDGSGVTGSSFIDLIELIEDKMELIPTAYSIQCGQSLTIGDNLCSITNMNYSWWDITNPGSTIQLTNGTTILASGVSIPAGNTNGSQIQVSPNQSRIYELRRRVISSNGVPIAMNNCDKDVQINVTVSTNINIQKNVTSGTNVIPGSSVQFQLVVTNSTGNALTNVNINDVLNPDLLVGTLFVASNSNLSYSVIGNTIDFVILNLPDGASETIDYSVQLNPSTTQTAITNCARVEYAGCYQEDCVDLAIGACTCPGWPQSIPNGSRNPTAEIQVASNGDVYVTGGLDAPSSIVNCGNTFNISGPGGFVAKYNSCGKLIWVESLPMPGVDLALFEAGGTTNLYVIGHKEVTPFGSFIARLIDNGASITPGWIHNMPGMNNANAIDLDNAGNLYVIGDYRTSINIPGGGPAFSTANDFAVFIAKFNTAGVHTWSENIVNSGTVIPACGINALSLQGKGISVNETGSVIYALGGGHNATVLFSNCTLTITPTNVFCSGGDIFVAAYEGGGSSYSCQWVDKVSGVGTNAASGIACNKNTTYFYFAGWATNTSTSSSGFGLPPLAGPPNDTRGHFIASYQYLPNVGGSFQSVYRDDFTSQPQYTDHFEDVFWDKNNDQLYVTATQDEQGKTYLHKHNPNLISSSIWVIPQPTIDGAYGHSSVATNGLPNGNGFMEVFMTGNHNNGVIFNVNTIGGVVPVSYPHTGIFILKIEDHGMNAIIKE